ncbi:MAG TPA: Asp-tRNA(Asn)/Glu-tRNA(Gln) amidotransferase GatCAB subunit B, partial [Atopostipes sp.]|nr:Asp-tRNA(Asn)/Glu-tRNA(Gln) amidotransferase GatCAB subunit B [Atopostipes sp.]
LIEDQTISSKIAKRVFTELMKEEVTDVRGLVEEKGWAQLSDPNELIPIISEVLDNNEQSVEDFKGGKKQAQGFLIGQIMKATRGNANPGVVNKLLAQELNKR